jgi:hypothetical protein
VTFWVAAAPGNSLGEQQAAAFGTLAARYPQAAAALARGGKPMDVEDRQLAEQIYREYVGMLDAGIAARIQPLVQALEDQGFAVRTAPGLPAVTVTLPKRLVLEMASRDDIGAVYLADGRVRWGLDSAVPTNQAPLVWARGYDGSPDVEIAILETDNVDFTSFTVDCPADSNNCFQHPGSIRPGVDGEQRHATMVASAAASNSPTWRGMAPDVTVMSAGLYGYERQDAIDALVWAVDHGAEVVNFSEGWCTDSPDMDVIDRAFDYYAR